MIAKKLVNLSLLEQDLWFNFCYYYHCEYDDVSIATENQSYIDQKEKIIKRMRQNDFSVNEERVSFAEMMGSDLNIPFKPSQLAELLTQLKNGLSYEQIATNLYISYGTVRKHIENIYRKLNEKLTHLS